MAAAHLPRLLPCSGERSLRMGPDVGGGGGGAGAQRCAAGAAGCLVGLPHRPLLLEPEAGEEGKVDGEGLAQWGRWGAPGPGGEARGAGREGPGRRKRVEGEGSIRIAGAPLRIAFNRHLTSSRYWRAVTRAAPPTSLRRGEVARRPLGRAREH